MKLHYVSDYGQDKILAITTENGGYLEIVHRGIIVKTNRHTPVKLTRTKTTGYVKIEQGSTVFTMFFSDVVFVEHDHNLIIKMPIPQDVKRKLFEMFRELNKEDQ